MVPEPVFSRCPLTEVPGLLEQPEKPPSVRLCPPRPTQAGTARLLCGSMRNHTVPCEQQATRALRGEAGEAGR